jgi:AcrR family transcriptional regulator
VAGARQEKKAATQARIAAAGLRLFLDRGYDATTLDDIAETAGISRRTFFYYFKSKDDVLLAWHGAGAISSTLGSAMLQRSPDQSPLDAAARCLMELASRYETDESKAMDALMQSSDTLRMRKDAIEIRSERDLATAMSTLWPGPSRRMELRIAAMIAIGILRLSLEDWRHEMVRTPLAAHLERNFRTLSLQTKDRSRSGPSSDVQDAP